MGKVPESLWEWRLPVLFVFAVQTLYVFPGRHGRSGAETL